MPGYERAELSAELRVVQPTEEHLQAVRDAAAETGLAHEAGPETVVLSGGRGEVLEATLNVLNAALDAGARNVDVRIEAEGDAPRFEEEA
jgi:rRNA maturation endonuclease Nob1